MANNEQELIAKAIAIEYEDAAAVGKLGFVARALVQATIPHSKIAGNEFERRNGNFRLTMLAPSYIGLPYGSVPRVVLSWITTEAVRTKDRVLLLGDSLSEFMRELGFVPTGGRWGSITRLKEQMKRLLSCSISCHYDGENGWGVHNMAPVEKAELWWNPKAPLQKNLWESNLTLSEAFFNEIVANPIPIRIEALKALKSSSMSLDIYCWLTYRNSYAKRESKIPWVGLQNQFGAGYSSTGEGKRNFKKKFLMALKRVFEIYPSAGKLTAEENFLIFRPGSPDVPKKSFPLLGVGKKVIHA